MVRTEGSQRSKLHAWGKSAQLLNNELWKIDSSGVSDEVLVQLKSAVQIEAYNMASLLLANDAENRIDKIMSDSAKLDMAQARLDNYVKQMGY